jgi:hypothetical protein
MTPIGMLEQLTEPLCEFIEVGNRYVTKEHLIDLAKKGLEWDYNRQLDDSIAEVGDFNYPIIAALTHHHKHGERCEEHIRATISIRQSIKSKPEIVLVDMPKDYWNALPRFVKTVKGT